MNDTVYQLMDWRDIETLVYSEHDNPHQLLGPHKTDHGILVNAFIPTAKMISVKFTKSGEDVPREYPMDLEDESGFFATLLDVDEIIPYTLKITYDDGSVKEIHDPYAFDPVITKEDCDLFAKGIHYKIYERLGAHIMSINGVKGTLFAVWAPNVMRASVVGDFNHWDGRCHQMRRLGDSGIFELFIPGIGEGALYKYEMKAKGCLTYLKADPYANYTEVRPANASIVFNLNKYRWSDKSWMDNRKKWNHEKKPMSIYEVHLGSWRKPKEENGSFYNYRDIAHMLCDYVKYMGYTHIEIMPIMEHPLDASWGYQVTGYYSATSRYGTPDDFMYFMDYMHQNNIGVILDWVPAHFPKDSYGLSNFDGTCLYEHLDPRQGCHPHWGTLIYNYGRPQVANFLVANALFWADKFHADGIRMDAVASMLYLDYGKNDGEWVANKYGGHENLEAIELLRQLNAAFKKRKDGAIIIAEESTSWPMITGPISDGGIGFDYKWNMGWMNDFTNYMKQDPLFRKGCHGALTFSMDYAYSEKFVLVLSHDEVVHGKASMINKMPGDKEQKFANLRAAYGFMATHPGKKLLFMGQEFAQLKEWNENVSLEWGLLQDDMHKKMQQYVKDLNHLYRNMPALYELDHNPAGFSWISKLDADHSIISFVRKTKRREDMLFVICNFTPVVYNELKVAVPHRGQYKEIFNSDDTKYGGTGVVNPKICLSKREVFEGQNNTITIQLPPLAVVIFSYKSIEEKKQQKKNTKKEANRETKKK